MLLLLHLPPLAGLLLLRAGAVCNGQVLPIKALQGGWPAAGVVISQPAAVRPVIKLQVVDHCSKAKIFSLQDYSWALSLNCKHWLPLSRQPAGSREEPGVLKCSLWS